MEMTNEEICREYHQAKHRQNQIKILADRNLCSIEEIRQILIDAGELKPKPKKQHKSTNAVGETVESVDVIAESVDKTANSVSVIYKPVDVTTEQPKFSDWKEALKVLTEHITELRQQRDFAEQELGAIFKALGELCGKG